MLFLPKWRRNDKISDIRQLKNRRHVITTEVMVVRLCDHLWYRSPPADHWTSAARQDRLDDKVENRVKWREGRRLRRVAVCVCMCMYMYVYIYNPIKKTYKTTCGWLCYIKKDKISKISRKNVGGNAEKRVDSCRRGQVNIWYIHLYNILIRCRTWSGLSARLTASGNGGVVFKMPVFVMKIRLRVLDEENLCTGYEIIWENINVSQVYYW